MTLGIFANRAASSLGSTPRQFSHPAGVMHDIPAKLLRIVRRLEGSDEPGLHRGRACSAVQLRAGHLEALSDEATRIRIPSFDMSLTVVVAAREREMVSLVAQ